MTLPSAPENPRFNFGLFTAELLPGKPSDMPKDDGLAQDYALILHPNFDFDLYCRKLPHPDAQQFTALMVANKAEIKTALDECIKNFALQHAPWPPEDCTAPGRIGVVEAAGERLTLRLPERLSFTTYADRQTEVKTMSYGADAAPAKWLQTALAQLATKLQIETADAVFAEINTDIIDECSPRFDEAPLPETTADLRKEVIHLKKVAAGAAALGVAVGFTGGSYTMAHIYRAHHQQQPPNPNTTAAPFGQGHTDGPTGELRKIHTVESSTKPTSKTL